MIALLIALLALAPPPVDDLVVVRVNFRNVKVAELQRELDRRGGDTKAALRAVVERALLLQEADHSGLVKDLPTEPEARASAFLRAVVSERVVCSNITPRELREMYGVMKPRFVRGELVRLAELRWHCAPDQTPEQAECHDQARTWADERWRPVLDGLVESQDLYWLAELETAPMGTRYVEYTAHRDEHGRMSVPGLAAEGLDGIEPGTATVVVGPSGARVQLLLERRAPLTRTLADPGVKDEVIAELCPRLLERSRKTYVDDLIRSAAIDVRKDRVPGGLQE